MADSHPSFPAEPVAGAGIVALAASAGGLRALSVVLSGLPASFPLPIVVLQHLDPSHRSLMPGILSRRTVLTVKQAEDGERITPGNVYVAAPDHHLLVDGRGRLSFSHAQRVHFARPSADLLFESVARAYGARAIAVVLSGSGSDGAVGVQMIEKTGGTVVVQDPETADFPGMPRAALATGCARFRAPLEDIPALLNRLARGALA